VILVLPENGWRISSSKRISSTPLYIIRLFKYGKLLQAEYCPLTLEPLKLMCYVLRENGFIKVSLKAKEYRKSLEMIRETLEGIESLMKAVL
jgi:hypothetical protein